jgi:hypothetical protein
MLAGAFGALAITNRGTCSGEDCGLASFIIGGAIGESIGLAVGTHYGSRGRGNVALAALASTAIGAAGLAGAFAAERAAPVILIAVPIVQLAVTLAMER